MHFLDVQCSHWELTSVLDEIQLDFFEPTLNELSLNEPWLYWGSLVPRPSVSFPDSLSRSQTVCLIPRLSVWYA